MKGGISGTSSEENSGMDLEEVVMETQDALPARGATLVLSSGKELGSSTRNEPIQSEPNSHALSVN